jgi:hypothetical protein
MTSVRIANVCFWIAIVTSAAAVAQPLAATTDQPARTTHEVSTRLIFDVNGRPQPIEVRSSETREAGPSDYREEETIRRPDSSGTLVLSERNVIRRSDANGSRLEVIETYAYDGEGFIRSDGHLALHQRVRISTTATSDGGRQTVEEVEGHNLAAYRDPMRVIRRVVETVRQIGPARWITDRQIFELDLNGRLVPIRTEREERAAR